jgi:hypothetical protein
MLGSGKYEHVITMKLDRMFRLVSDMLATVDELRLRVLEDVTKISLVRCNYFKS